MEQSGSEGREREAQWENDRAQEAKPLPYSDLRKYANEGQRQTDLAAAEKSNIARAAGDLDLTVPEYEALRSKLGRSPGRGDVRK